MAEEIREKPVLTPGPDHPITVEPTGSRLVVRVDGKVLADTRDALTLREADYPPVQYVPLADVDGSLLLETDHSSYCPYKGDANYYSVAGVPKAENAIWEYRDPRPAVAEIKGHVAFYPDRVDSIEQHGES
jgi:uncharacterized protein (DUF427 family)